MIEFQLFILPSYTLISSYWQVELFIPPIPWLVHIGRLNYLSFLYLDLCYIGRLSYLSFLFLDLCHIGRLSYLSFLFLDLCIIVMLSYLSFLFLDLCHIGRLSYLSFHTLICAILAGWAIYPSYTLICAILAGWAILPIPWFVPYWQVELSAKDQHQIRLRIQTLLKKDKFNHFTYMFSGIHVRTNNLWNRKTTFRLDLWLYIVQWAWDLAIVQCKQTHFT